MIEGCVCVCVCVCLFGLLCHVIRCYKRAGLPSMEGPPHQKESPLDRTSFEDAN